jgi:hypothetical protein
MKALMAAWSLRRPPASRSSATTPSHVVTPSRAVTPTPFDISGGVLRASARYIVTPIAPTSPQPDAPSPDAAVVAVDENPSQRDVVAADDVHVQTLGGDDRGVDHSLACTDADSPSTVFGDSPHTRRSDCTVPTVPLHAPVSTVPLHRSGASGATAASLSTGSIHAGRRALRRRDASGARVVEGRLQLGAKALVRR